MLRLNRRTNECPYYLDLSAPTAVQMKSVVKGHDLNYQIGRKRSSFWTREISYAALVLVLLIAAFGSFVVIAVVAR